MGSAVHSTLEFGVGYSTLELSVNYIRPVPAAAGVVLTATATTIHVGRRTATIDCRVHDPEGRLVAHGTSTCMVLGNAGPGSPASLAATCSRRRGGATSCRRRGYRKHSHVMVQTKC